MSTRGTAPITRVEEVALVCLLEALSLTSRGPDLWPTWRLAGVPFLFYKPGGRGLLVRHPHPPSSASPVTWPGLPGGMKVYRVELPVPVTEASVEVNGVETACIPLNDINRAVGPYEEMVAMICHQGFHVHQKRFSQKYNVLHLHRRYPDLSPVNNALGQLEGMILFDALATGDEKECRQLARMFALIRRERRKEMDDSLIRYEKGNEFREGLATYVEVLALRRGGADGYRCHPAFRHLAGMSHYRNAGALLDNRLQELKRVNHQGHGADWWRFFHTGMGLALVLDLFGPEWRREVEKPGVFLDDLLERHITFDGGNEDDRLIAAAEARYGYVDRLDREKEYAATERRRKEQVLESILRGQGTRLTLDVKGLRLTDARWNPIRTEKISDVVRIHKEPAVFLYGETVLAFQGIPVVEDERHGLFHVCVEKGRPVFLGDDKPFLIDRPAEFTEGLEINIGGLRVKARKGYIQLTDGTVYVKIQR